MVKKQQEKPHETMIPHRQKWEKKHFRCHRISVC